MAVERRGARGESEKAVGSSGEATMMFLAFSGRDGAPPPLAAWVKLKKPGLGLAEAFLFPSEWTRQSRCGARLGAGLGVRHRLHRLALYYWGEKN